MTVANYCSVKMLNVTRPFPPITVHNAEGRFTGTDHSKAALQAITAWFQNHFTHQEDNGLDIFQGNARPLQTPIAEDGSENGHLFPPEWQCCRPRQYQQGAVQISYAKDIVAKPIVSIISASFEQHRPIETLSEGIMITLPTPKKPAGPPANIRPIVCMCASQ